MGQDRYLALSWILGLFYVLSTSGGYGAQGLVPVEVTTAEKTPIYQEIPLSASVMARRSSSLSAKVDGLVSEVLVDDGQFVNRGDVLIKLDQELAELTLKRARAALEEGEAQLKESKRQRDEIAELVTKRHVSATSYKAAIADVAMKTAALKRIQAELQHQQEIVQRHIVEAPFTGVIGKKLVEIGQWVDQGDSVTELVELDLVRINVEVPQRYFQILMPGTPVVVRFDAMPEKIFEAEIGFKISVGNPAARTFPIRIDMENRQHQIVPGMSARVVFLLKKKGSKPVVTLPRDAVVKTPEGLERVWRLTRQADHWVVEPVNVKTGVGLKHRIRILGADIRAGDVIVIRGNESLKSGQKVQIIND